MYQLLDDLPERLIIDKRKIPDKETVDAFQECADMLKNGSGQRYEGATDELFKNILLDQK